MLKVVLGVTYGAALGYLGNWVLFRVVRGQAQRGGEPVRAVGAVFFFRLLADGLALVAWWVLTADPYSLIAAALSTTIAVKISLFLVLRRTGGKLP